MDLFTSTDDLRHAPLAARMRPRALEEVVGQQHLIGAGAVLRRAIQGDTVPSMILHGPAGTGKSTLAMIVAKTTGLHFEMLSAVSAGVEDIRKVAAAARDRRSFHDQGTILFVDEIHRLNKGQQDALLPHVEAGVFTLIGATTENPYFSVITPLLSRCRLFTLQSLTPDEIRTLLERALVDEQRGVASLQPDVTEDALQHLAEGALGDARAALGALELALLTTTPGEDGRRKIDLAAAVEALQKPVLKYDRAGDEHYDTISAFIKSMRGSDPDAAVYWLAKMLESGEDPLFIARRIVIQAAEDVGLADPTALRVAIAAKEAVQFVGLPEAQIPLAMAVIHLATAPKSNSAYLAIAKAREEVRKGGGAKVPGHLAGGMRPQDSRKDYLYPHDHPGSWVKQDYLPPGLQGKRFYEPKDNARERRIAEWLKELRGET